MPRMEELNQHAQERGSSSDNEPQRGLARGQKNFANHILNEDSSTSNQDSPAFKTQQYQVRKSLSKKLSAMNSKSKLGKKSDSFFGWNQAVFETGRSVYFPKVDSAVSFNSQAMKQANTTQQMSSDTDFGSKRVKFEFNPVDDSVKTPTPVEKSKSRTSCLRPMQRTLKGRLNSQRNLIEPESIGDQMT